MNSQKNRETLVYSTKPRTQITLFFQIPLYWISEMRVLKDHKQKNVRNKYWVFSQQSKNVLTEEMF